MKKNRSSNTKTTNKARKPAVVSSKTNQARKPEVASSKTNQTGGHKNRKPAKTAPKAKSAQVRQRSSQMQAQDLFGRNEFIELEVIGLTHDGDGVGRTADGFTFFVAGALPGERIGAKVLKMKKQYGFAKLTEIRIPSKDRVDAPCPIYSECGGCQLQHLDYEAELVLKRQHVIDNLTRIGKLKVAGESEALSDTGSAEGKIVPSTKQKVEHGDHQGAFSVAEREVMDGTSGQIVVGKEAVGLTNEPGKAEVGFALKDSVKTSSVELIEKQSATSEEGIIVHATVGMANPWHYRNKAAVPVGKNEKTGEMVGGFYAKGSHRIIEMDKCIIQKEKNDEVVQIVKDIAQELRMIPYDEENGTGVLRHIMARVGVVTGEVMIVLITNIARLPRQPEWIEHIRKRIPNVKSIVHNVNDKVTNAIFGETTNIVWGKEVIYDELDGIRFAISARSFYQVNPEQTISLYRKAVEYAGLTGTEQVIDAYCGIGTISLFLARNAGHVYGVEIVPEAIEDAKRNAELNEMSNTTFEAGPAEVVIPRWKKEGMKADVIVVDPPRKGCDPALLETILAIKPKRVVYVSCNPSTLARDLRVLEDGGYKTVEVTPVDMFPHTGHVESVCLLIYKGFE